MSYYSASASGEQRPAILNDGGEIEAYFDKQMRQRPGFVADKDPSRPTLGAPGQVVPTPARRTMGQSFGGGGTLGSANI